MGVSQQRSVFFALFFTFLLFFFLSSFLYFFFFFFFAFALSFIYVYLSLALYEYQNEMFSLLIPISPPLSPVMFKSSKSMLHSRSCKLVIE